MNEKTLNLLLFGATGQTGKHFLTMALNNGHRVTAIVRNPNALDLKHPNLRVVKGDAMQIETFDHEVENKDAVISAIGSGNAKPTKLFSQGVKNMLITMERKSVKRIICISAAGIEINPTHSLFMKFLIKNLLQRILKNPYKDYHIMEKHLKDSDMDWTSVRPPMLTNKPLTKQYRYAINDWLKNCAKIRRADLAYFMLQIISDPKTYKSVIEVAN